MVDRQVKDLDLPLHLSKKGSIRVLRKVTTRGDLTRGVLDRAKGLHAVQIKEAVRSMSLLKMLTRSLRLSPLSPYHIKLVTLVAYQLIDQQLMRYHII